LALMNGSGGNVFSRVVARHIESARLLLSMRRWLNEIELGEAFHAEVQLPESGRAAGLIEAARGSLGHWVTVEKGVITGYQIIAPTTWNFSPRDAAGNPGALEQALVGTAVDDGDKHAVAIQHVVRSFDPCMVCTVH
uniref:nickel-dependent hydrogenase large subunit n=1 Tax=Sedimenticola sp. TaxID=1940285 RepID=UPI003D0A1C1E